MSIVMKLYDKTEWYDTKENTELGNVKRVYFDYAENLMGLSYELYNYLKSTDIYTDIFFRLSSNNGYLYYQYNYDLNKYNKMSIEAIIIQLVTLYYNDLCQDKYTRNISKDELVRQINHVTEYWMNKEYIV